MKKIVFIIFLLSVIIGSGLASDNQKQSDFEAVFGDQVRFNQSMVKKTLSEEYGIMWIMTAMVKQMTVGM